MLLLENEGDPVKKQQSIDARPRDITRNVRCLDQEAITEANYGASGVDDYLDSMFSCRFNSVDGDTKDSTKPNEVCKFEDERMPMYMRSIKGDMYVTYEVSFPTPVPTGHQLTKLTEVQPGKIIPYRLKVVLVVDVDVATP